MATISILEFQELSGLSDSGLAHFLKEFGHLCSVDATGIGIDVDALETRKALDKVFELRRNTWLQSKESIQSMIARIVGEKMDSILAESLEPLTKDAEPKNGE